MDSLDLLVPGGILGRLIRNLLGGFRLLQPQLLLLAAGAAEEALLQLYA